MSVSAENIAIWNRLGLTATNEVVIMPVARLDEALSAVRDEGAAEINRLKSSVAVLESFRPHWAQGYSDDSTAAQAATGALASLWGVLGANDQTAAMAKLKELVG